VIAKEFTITNKYGIHARPAALIAKTANRFKSTIKVRKDTLEVNGKSIMGILMLAAARGNTITVVADGVDEKEAIESLGEVINMKFDEE
jgi:phosphocarrier protein HPr